MTQKRIAVVPVVRKNKRHQVCLITSRCHRRWIIPTGKPEKKRSDRKVAEIEAFEEAGVTGKLDKRFDKTLLVSSPSGRKKRKTHLFIIHVEKRLRNWPEKHERRRKFVDLEKLEDFVCDKRLSRLIKSRLSG